MPAAFHVEERRGTVAGTSRFAVGMVAVACPEPVRDQTVVGVRDVRSLRYPKAKHIRLPGALPVATGARRVGVKRNRNVAVIEIGDATAVMVGRIVPAVYPAHDSVVILALDVAGQFQSVRERVDGIVPLLPYRAVQLREWDAVIVEGKAGLHCIYLLYFLPCQGRMVTSRTNSLICRRSSSRVARRFPLQVTPAMHIRSTVCSASSPRKADSGT